MLFFILNVLILFSSIDSQTPSPYGPIVVYKTSDPKPIKIIFDTDGATDDMRALTLALQTPSVEVIAIMATHGSINTSQVVANVNRILALNGLQGKIPIFKGSDTPFIINDIKKESYFNGLDGLGERPDVDPKALPSYPTMYQTTDTAAEALVKIAKLNPDSTLVATGSLTNIALALKLDPDFSQNFKKLVIMGGNYLGIGNIYPGHSVEWNFAMDPEAASIVLREFEAPITIIPWEAYYILGQNYSHYINYTKHLALDTPLAKFFLPITAKGREILGGSGSEMAYVDEIAMGVAINEEKMVKESKNLNARVELSGQYTRGQIVPEWVNRNFVEAKIDKQFPQPRCLIKFVIDYDVGLLDEWINKAFAKNVTNFLLISLRINSIHFKEFVTGMVDYKQRRQVEKSDDETISTTSISIQLAGRLSQAHDCRQRSSTNRAPTSNRRPASRSRPKERDRWRDEPKETTTFAKPRLSTKDFPMKAEHLQILPVTSEKHPHFMRTLPRQTAISIRLEKPQSVQQGAVMPVSKAKRNWAGLRVVPSLVETPKVTRYEFSLPSEHSRLTIINTQPIRQVAHFVAPQAERLESDFWRPEECGFILRTVQALDPPPSPFVAEILKPEWETIFYTLSLGKHVAIEQRIRTIRVQKLNHHIAKRQQAAVLGPRTYRRMEQPQEIVKIRAYPSHSIRLSTVEDPSNQHRVTYLNRNGAPVSMLPQRSRSRSKEKRRQPIEPTKNVPCPNLENWNPRDRFEPSNRRVSPRRRRKTLSSYRSTISSIESRRSDSKKPDSDFVRHEEESIDEHLPMRQQKRAVLHRVPSKDAYQPRPQIEKPHRPVDPNPSRIEYVSSKKKPVRKSRKRPSWESQCHKRGRKSRRPPRTYHIDVEIGYDDDDEDKKKQKDPRKPKQRAQCSETNVTLPREERREESYRPCLIKSTKLMRREEPAKKSFEMMTAEEIQDPTLSELTQSKRTKSNEQTKPDADELELKTAVKGPSDSVRTARAHFFASESAGSPQPKRTPSGHYLYQVVEGDLYKRPRKKHHVPTTDPHRKQLGSLTEHAPLMETAPLQQKPKSPPPPHQENKIPARKPATHHHDTNAHKKKLPKLHQKSKQMKTHQGSKDKQHRRTKIHSAKGTPKKASRNKFRASKKNKH
ncbi:unnamed protein product, partial [Mesorhabditis belari]|uniref:Inosine/uridine-preferring nucleoside hydrolase domain-containing protein n=1 Tax=Mesorhabditis belari TaxID=2138241 RepID=A0AAF3J2T5_9BILA